MEAQKIYTWEQPMLDGSNFGNMTQRSLLLSMSMAKSWKLMEVLTEKTPTLLVVMQSLIKSSNNSKLFMLMKFQLHQRLEILIRNGVSRLEFHSTCKQLCHQKDILILLVQTWSSRLKTDSHLKNGTLITRRKWLAQWELNTGHGRSKTQVDQPTWKLIMPNHNGLHFSDGTNQVVLSIILTTKRFLMLKEA